MIRGAFIDGSICFLFGLLRAARSGGIPVTAGRFVRKPAAPLSILGMLLILLARLDTLVVALLPGV